jgi:hypothetical protein
MAGDYSGPGHKIVSGEEPVVGLRVITNELQEGTITTLAPNLETAKCGWYCEAWHTVTYDDGRTITMNCDRLTTKMPRGL